MLRFLGSVLDGVDNVVEQRIDYNMVFGLAFIYIFGVSCWSISAVVAVNDFIECSQLPWFMLPGGWCRMVHPTLSINPV